MKSLPIVSFSVLIAMLIYFGNNSLKFGSTSVPPIMKFTNPFSGFWNNAIPVEKPQDNLIRLTGLSGEVKIIFDERMVPHIFAANMSDALFAQGYLHAKFRLFQMDLSVRSAGGRLAEILGSQLLSTDRQSRNMGMRYGAEASVRGWEKFPENMKLLQNYTDGINAFIENLDVEDYPLEFKLLDYAPEKWTVMHSALFFKNMNRMLASGNSDIGSTNIRNSIGQSLFDELYPDWNPKQSPIIPIHYATNTQDINVNEELPSIEGSYGFDQLPKFPPTIGSNNWAVSGAKTKSGNPILCNDPHLGLTLPSIWYEIHIHTPETNVYGVSLPSMPGVIIGFNEHIAWGVTNVGHDVTDWYKMKWMNDSQTEYEYNGEKRKVEYVYETIKVKGEDDIIDTIKYTVHGPVIRNSPSQKNYSDLAMKWLAHTEPDLPEMSTFINLNLAKNYVEFKEAISAYIAPAQNFVFASVDGDIALHVNGIFPAREKNGGKFIKDGSVVDPDWLRYIPRDSVPHILNPTRQFVSSANQHSTYPDYPYYYLGGFEDFRGRTINEQLSTMNQIEAKDMMELQNDNVSIKARDILPQILSIASENNISDEAIDILNNWDYSYMHDAVAPTLFDRLMDYLYDQTFDEITMYRDSFSIRSPDYWKLIELLTLEKENAIFDIKNTTSISEKGDDIIMLSLDSIRVFYKEATASNTSLKWSDYNQRSINHMARLPAFSKTHLPVNGCGDVPNANFDDHGPSWRMIVELEKGGIKAYGVYPGGQDGNPGSPYYDTGIENWIAGQYFELFIPKDLASAQSKAHCTVTLSK